MIAEYWGLRLSLPRLRQLCDMSRAGVSIGELTAGLERIGLHAVAARLPKAEATRMPLPSILYWNQNHFVVLYNADSKGRYFNIADPARGKVKIPAQEFYHSWCGDDQPSGSANGIVILAEPSDEFKPHREQEKSGRNIGRLVIDNLRHHHRHFILIILLALIAMAADVSLPLLLQHTVDQGIAKRDVSLVWMLVLSQLFVFLGYYVTNTLSDFVLTKLGLNMGIDMINRYLCKLIRLPMDFFERKVKADLIQKAEDQNRIKDFMLTIPQTLLFASLSLVLFSALLIYYSASIFALFLIMTLTGIGWSLLFMQRRKSIDQSLNACASENRNNLYELVHGMPEIKTNNAEQVRLSRWHELQQKSNRLSVKAYMVRFMISGGQNLITRVRDIAITGICATLVINGQMTLGGMMTVSYIVGRLASPFATLLNSLFTVQDAVLSYERVDEILNSPESPSGLATHVNMGDMVLKNVSFKYPGAASPKVLDDVNLTIAKGTTVAVVGPSGCGKSTLIKIILGLFQPTEGSVSVNGVDLGTVEEEAWLAHCGIVMQSGTIFSSTLAENIALCEEKPDMERVAEAIKLACLEDFVATLPMGYRTKLGVAGIELSGGQRQRLLIARAIYRNPDLIILDEATSSLDAANESRIVANIQKFKTGRTMIVAAHRLSTIRHADTIIYMSGGRITEQGSHQQLMNLGGDYASLVKGQL